MKTKNIKKPMDISEEHSDDDSQVESVEEEEDDEMSEASSGDVGTDDDDEDLAASETESDEDDEEEEDEEEEEQPISKSEIIKKEVLEKYEKTHGKRLYIRFPRTTTDAELEQKAKDLSPLITNVHIPRQKYARFCLVDFETKEDRDQTLKSLKKLIKKGELEKYQVDIPRTESAEYVEQIVERKIKSLENKKVKARLKKASRKAGSTHSFTSTVLVFNLPKATTAIQIRELFPSAVDVQIKAGKGKQNKDKSVAAVTLSSTMEARSAVKAPKLSLGGNQLLVKFDNPKIKKNTNAQQKSQVPNNSPKTDDSTDKDQSKLLPKKKDEVTEEESKPKIPQNSVEINGKTSNKRKLVFKGKHNNKDKNVTKAGGINKKKVHKNNKFKAGK